jgi:DNA-binding SARP family transcriptional activator
MIEHAPSGLTIKLFGIFEARLNGVLISDLQVREGERLLALLTLNQGYNQQGHILASTLWPETGSLDSLRASIAHLRNVLGDEASRLKTPKGALFLDLAGVDVDVIAFEKAVAHGDLYSLQEAITLYRGPLLLGWETRHPEDSQWVLRAREKRKERFRDALKVVARAYLANNEWEIAAEYLKQYVAVSPADEWAWSDWMKALVEQGERINAMNLFTRCRRVFHENYQLPPPAVMSQLYQQLQQRIPLAQTMIPEDEARLEPVGGAVPLHSPYYILRDTDQAFQSAIARRDGLVLLKGPRQTGKTSLLARGLQQARDMGSLVIVTDFQRISSRHWTSQDTFLMALAKSLTEQLELKGDPQNFWRDDNGPNENFARYLEREVLRKVPEPIVWALDEVDRVFAYPFRNDIFGLFRSLYNDRVLNPTGPWVRLTLAMAYATEAHLFITDLNQSPFNVGTRLVLEDFLIDQVRQLNTKYGNPLSEQDTLTRFFLTVGGNPYLVRRGLHEIVARNWDFAAFEVQASQNEGCYGDHLKRMLHALTQDAELSEIVRGLLRDKPCTSLEGFSRLQSAGVLAGGTPETARFRCRIYKTYLGAHLA